MNRPFSNCVIAAATVSAVFGLIAGCAQTGEAGSVVATGTVIRNVTVVDTRDGSLHPGMAVVVDQGKIKAVERNDAVHTGGAAQVIDASGKFVVPGYNDMHAHSIRSVDQNPTFWPLFIANGVTGVRDMNGSAELIQRARKLNADRAAGRVDAPEIVLMSGDLLVGQVPEPAAAVAFVQKQKAIGADFVKVIVANREVALAVLAEARQQNIPVAGHLPLGLEADAASNAGWRAMEHLGSPPGLGLDCSAEGPDARRALLSGEGAKPMPFSPQMVVNPMLGRGLDAPFYERVFASYDPVKCKNLAALFVKNETWQVPTLIRLRTMLMAEDRGYREDPNLIYVDKTLKALWQQASQQYERTTTPAQLESFRRSYAGMLRLTKFLKDNGVKMLAGSDQGGIWIVPGFGLHQEFRELAAAGFSPLQILQMTTLNAAQFLNHESAMGTVEAGKNADLVLLDANPIADAANLSRIWGVVLNGKYFPKPALDKMKSDVAAAYAAQAPKSMALAVDMNHRH